jgi:RNA polymerase sigma-70 factor (ECF subfamily)
MSKQALRTDADFEALYERNWLYVYRLCYSYMGNQADAEDCTEDVFVKVLSGNITFKDSEHERKCFSVAACNRCKDKLKSSAFRLNDSLDAEEAPEIAAPEQKDYSDVREAVLALPERLKTVVVLYYYGGYKAEEIAKQFGKSPSTVRNLLKEARDQLREKLGGAYDEGEE